MELTPTHRKYLLSQLDTHNDLLKSFDKCLDKSAEDELYPLFQIDCFIEQQLIALIKKSLIDNQIEF